MGEAFEVSTSVTERALQSVTCATPERVDPETGEITVVTPDPLRDKKSASKLRFRNGCCSARDLCPKHRIIAANHRAKTREAMEKRGLKPYSFEDQRGDELIALAHDLHGPILPPTSQAPDQVFAIANYLTGEPYRFKQWLADAAPWYCENDADELLDRLNRKRYRFKSAKLAALFDVTWERKQRLGIKTITALDTPADVIEAKKARQRERDRQYRSKQRRRLGITPRAQYEAKSVSQTELWKVAGFNCRRTWERHGKPTPKAVSQVCRVPYSSSSTRTTHLRHSKSLGCAEPTKPSKKSAERRERSNGTPCRQRRASRTARKGSGEKTLRLSAKPSPSPQWSSYGQSAKTESQQASLGTALGMGSNGIDIDSQIWPLISRSAEVEAEPASMLRN